VALFNHSSRELTAKIVYYGPALGGKTTNLRSLHAKLDQASRGRLLSLATAQDRTIYFDLLPVELGNIKGYTVRFQLCTVPGQVFYNETRKIVLRGVDGVVFVVDSQPAMLSHALESFQNLRENLREEKVALESLPVVIQYNKRDLPSALSVAALQESLGFSAYPFVEASAANGAGIVETFRLVSKLTFVDLLRRLQRGEPGVTETAAAALAAVTEPAPVTATDGPEPVFAHTERGPDLPRESPTPVPAPEPVSVTASSREPEGVVAGVEAETEGGATAPGGAAAPASPAVPTVAMLDGLGLEEDGEGWESEDDLGPGFHEEPPLDSSLVTSELNVEADYVSTRAIAVPASLPPLLPPEPPEVPTLEAIPPAGEAGSPEAAGTGAEPSPEAPADAAPPLPPLSPLSPAPETETSPAGSETLLSARMAALEEEIGALRGALAESRSREDSLQARTEELARRWDALRRLLSEDGPAEP